MTDSKEGLVRYRLIRAKDTLEDAKLLATNQRWNSAINRLYYASYYAVMALLLDSDFNPTTHNGAKSNFTEHFIKTGIVDKEFGKIYAQLFTWRQKGDYDDLFDFTEDKVLPYFTPVADLLIVIEYLLTQK
jgi:uncharacterized protein (UPF0332 family)